MLCEMTWVDFSWRLSSPRPVVSAHQALQCQQVLAHYTVDLLPISFHAHPFKMAPVRGWWEDEPLINIRVILFWVIRSSPYPQLYSAFYFHSVLLTENFI